MSEPVIERIVQEVKARLAEITTANGYQQDLTPVRPIRGNFEAEENPENGKVLLVQGDAEEHETEIELARRWVQPLWLECFVIATHDDTTTPLDTLVNRVEADIVKKLAADRTRGGLAIDTIVRPGERRTDGPDATGILIRVDVDYLTSWGDPYTAR